jgi:serine/threonine protein kinase
MEVGKIIFKKFKDSKDSDSRDKYHLKQKLGNGGFGEVWLAEKELNTGATVIGEIKYALKFLTGEIDLAAFEKEIRSLTRVGSHINIISIRDAFECTAYVRPVIVTDFANGGSLYELIKNEVISLDKAVKIIEQVLVGLEYLHSFPIAHRDIKPGNILLRDGIACISDFGLAIDLEKTQTTRGWRATDNYYSPEYAKAKMRGNPFTVTEYEDLWATAVTFYQLILNNIESFPLLEGLENISKAKRQSLPKNFPSELVSFFDKAFHKNRRNRFQSATEMLVELKKITSIETKYQSEIERIKIEFNNKTDNLSTNLKETQNNLINLTSQLKQETQNTQILKKEKLSLEKRLSTEIESIQHLSAEVTLLKDELQISQSLTEEKTNENNYIKHLSKSNLI